MELTVTAPNRIDLAGGTTDLYPLYLLMDGGCTVNAAISVRSSVTIRPLAGRKIIIASRDLGESLEAGDPASLRVNGPLGLIARTVAAFPPKTGVKITTYNEAPAGSGLGASSALVLALLTGLLRLRGEEAPPATVIDLAANLETARIGVPAGKQDHIAALFGGVSLIDFGYRGFLRREICREPIKRARIEEMIVLSYTGLGRFSGMNNWEITKSFIDNREGIREKLLKIKQVALELSEAISNDRWEQLPGLVDREWTLRRSLSPGVSTPHIETIMSEAKAAGALASKICGAGGGGCMITLVGKSGRAGVERAISSAGGEVIPFSVDALGVNVTECFS